MRRSITKIAAIWRNYHNIAVQFISTNPGHPSGQGPDIFRSTARSISASRDGK